MTYKSADVSMIAESLKGQKGMDYSTNILIGAGMSVSAGIPPAFGIMEEIEQRWPGYISNCKDKTYQAYMDCIPKGIRRKLIGEFVDNSKINLAHLYLAMLIKEGYIETVLTTNFDPLVVKSLALHNIFPAIYDMAASEKFIPGEILTPAVFYLHGQRHGFVLLNTKDEVRRPSERIQNIFQDVSKKKCWIVIGYSGENDPVFELLTEIKDFDYGLFWVGYKNNEPQEHVLKNILNRKNTYYIKGHDADSFFIDLAIKLKLSEPQIIKTPFSHLKESIEMIAQYKKDDKSIDPTKEVKNWIETAIKVFEEGQGFQSIEEIKENRIVDDELVRKARDIWTYEKFSEIDDIFDDIINSDNPEAIEYLSYAIYNKGVSYFNNNLIDNASECYEKSIELNQKFSYPWNGLGNVYYNLKQYDKAIECYEKFIELDPNDSAPWNGLGNVYEDLQQYDKAIECYEKSIELDTNYSAPWNGLGIVYGDLQQYDKAIECYKKAISSNSKNPIFWHNLSFVYEKLNQRNKAKECYDKIDELTGKLEVVNNYR